MPVMLATLPIHDEDTQSSKNESKLRKCHLWSGQGNVGVAIVNLILLYIVLGIGPIHCSQGRGEVDYRLSSLRNGLWWRTPSTETILPHVLNSGKTGPNLESGMIYVISTRPEWKEAWRGLSGGFAPYKKTGLTTSSHFLRECAENDALSSVPVIHPQTEVESHGLFD